MRTTGTASGMARGTAWYWRLAGIVGAIALFVVSQQSELGIVGSLLIIIVSLAVFGWIAYGIYRDHVSERDRDQA
jgi:uncharacterized membrane protein YdcZ (DUF606 family)